MRLAASATRDSILILGESGREMIELVVIHSEAVSRFGRIFALERGLEGVEIYFWNKGMRVRRKVYALVGRELGCDVM